MTKMMKAAAALLMCLALSGCGCGHEDWYGADCTEPARCINCGKTEGLPKGHDWLDADCITPQTCADCGHTKGEPKGHSWKEADDDSPKTCRRCGVTEGEPLAPEPEAAEFEDVYEDVCKQIGSQLSKAEFVYDEDVCILYVSITAKKGTAESIVRDPDSVAEYWADISENICSVSRDAAESFRSAGFAVDCCIMLISDVNEENALLAAYNGEINYDVMQ